MYALKTLVLCFCIYGAKGQFGGSFEPDLLRGVVGIQSNQHKIGGAYHDEYTTYESCLAGCREDRYCLAVDFVERLQHCWFHDYTSACTAPLPQRGVKHVQLSVCITGVSVGGGDLVAQYVTERDCVTSCKTQDHCYGVDYNIRTQSCYHHYMGTICSTKKPNPDAMHYTRVNCRSSPNALEVSIGHYIPGGRINKEAFSEGDCTTYCVHDVECEGVDFYYTNNTCIVHTHDTICNPRFPQDGASHFQFVGCSPRSATVQEIFNGQVLKADGTAFGVHMEVATELVACINLCRMTAVCAAVDWNEQNNTCFFLNTDVGCNSVTYTPHVFHYELTNCKMSGDVRVFSDGFHVLGGEYKSEYSTKDRCIDKCMQPRCQAVDWDEEVQACYHHTEATSCNALVYKESCSHYKFVDCPTPIRSVIELRNASRLPGELARSMTSDAMTCIQYCADRAADCAAVDYNIDTFECVLHTEDDSCRDSVELEGWFSYIFSDCTVVIPGAVNITNAHVPGARTVQMAVDGEECFTKCKTSDSCVAADFNSGTSECYLHEEKTVCEPAIRKEGCTHFRLYDCTPQIRSTVQNAMIPGGKSVMSVHTEIRCFHLCKLDPFCVAFSFNTLKKECHVHELDTACDLTVDAISWAHHRLVECHDEPSTQITETVYGMYVIGGVLVSEDLQGPVPCLDKCVLMGSDRCLAVNYDFSTNGCYFHNSTTACGQLVPLANVSHYKLYDCDADRIPFKEKVYDYPGHRRMMEVGGPNAQTPSAEECIAACQAHGPCQGVDYSEQGINKGMCLFHYNGTACGVLIPDSDFSHYSFTDCEGQIIIAEEIYEDSTLPGGASVNVPSEVLCVSTCTGSCLSVSFNTDSQACVHYSAKDACGQLADSNGTKVYQLTDCEADLATAMVTASYTAARWGGGTLVPAINTKPACLGTCVDHSLCTAFSYNYREDKCYLHQDVGCAPVVKGEGSHEFTLYMLDKAKCDPDDIFYAEGYGKFHMAGGMLMGQYDQRVCLQQCAESPLCYKVDYNPANFACWFHGANSCDNQLVRDPRITHYKLKDCLEDDGV